MYSDKLKAVLKKEKVSVKQLASMLGKSPQTIYNTMNAEGKATPEKKRQISISYGSVEEMLDALGYEIVFRNKTTGEIVN